LAQNNHDIDKFLQPASTFAANKRKTVQSIVRKQPVKVSEAQSKDIMDNLLGELDQNDEDDLQDIGETAAGVWDKVGGAAGKSALLEDQGEIAFNQNDKLNLKYNIAVNQIGASKKRGIDQVSKTPQERRHNPFAKKQDDDVEIISPDQANESMHKQDDDVQVISQPEMFAKPSGEASAAAANAQDAALDEATNHANFALKDTNETDMDKEWR